MGMAAILVMWPGPFEQTFVPLSQEGSTWNLASIGPVVAEEKMFENVDNIGERTTEAYLSYKLTSESLLLLWFILVIKGRPLSVMSLNFCSFYLG